MRAKIAGTLEKPKGSLLSTWIRGLGWWRDPFKADWPSLDTTLKRAKR